MLIDVRKGNQMTHQEHCEQFAIHRASQMVETLTAEMAERIKNQPAITQRVGMYLVGSFDRAELNLAKLDELLKQAIN